MKILPLLCSASLTRILAAMGAAALLGGCVSDSASWLVDGRTNAVTLDRRQPYFWDKSANLELVVSRLPDCNRRSAVGSSPLGSTRVELFEVPPGVYAEEIVIARTATGTWAVGMENCEIQAFKTPPRLGKPIGVFADVGKTLEFQRPPATSASR